MGLPHYPIYCQDYHAAVSDSRAVADVLDERRAQDRKWGEQNHNDGTGGDVAERAARWLLRTCAAASDTTVGDTWSKVLAQEVAEAFAEGAPAALRRKLVHVAAVAVAWIEHIDRRTGVADTLVGDEAPALGWAVALYGKRGRVTEWHEYDPSAGTPVIVRGGATATRVVVARHGALVIATPLREPIDSRAGDVTFDVPPLVVA